MTWPISVSKLTGSNKWIFEGLILCFAEEQTSRERTGEHIITSVIKTKYKSKQKLRSDRFAISVELITAQNKGARGSELFIQLNFFWCTWNHKNRLVVMCSGARGQNPFIATITHHLVSQNSEILMCWWVCKVICHYFLIFSSPVIVQICTT